VCDELLTGGRMTAGIVRRGDRLLRPMGPWSPGEIITHGDLGPFVDAYGLAGRRSILPALAQAKLDVAERVRTWPVGPAGAAAALEFTAGELRWLEAVTPHLSEAL
jgi:hypothetical protein